MIFNLLYSSAMTTLELTASEKRDKLLVKGCHFKQTKKNIIFSRAIFSHGALQCKQVGVSRVQTRKSQRDWLSCSQQPDWPRRCRTACTGCISSYK